MVSPRGGRGPALETPATSRLANYEANVVSAVLVANALAPRLAENGRVITIGSIAGRRGGGSYGAAKAAKAAKGRGGGVDRGPGR